MKMHVVVDGERHMDLFCSEHVVPSIGHAMEVRELFGVRIRGIVDGVEWCYSDETLSVTVSVSTK